MGCVIVHKRGGNIDGLGIVLVGRAQTSALGEMFFVVFWNKWQRKMSCNEHGRGYLVFCIFFQGKRTGNMERVDVDFWKSADMQRSRIEFYVSKGRVGEEK